MLNLFLIFIGKAFSKLSKNLNLGNGSTWPGHIALGLNKNFISDILSNTPLQIILIAGTNGKTTTARLIRTALVENGKKVIQNESGANLLNGIASALILNSNLFGKLNHDFAIFEIDENNLPLILKEINPDFLILLNLFRDQLDRYGEVNTIAGNWKSAIAGLSSKTRLILNADDPQIAYLGNNLKRHTFFFGLDALKKIPQHAADSIYCPKCGNKLSFITISFSHLGNWLCLHCGLKRPTSDISDFEIYPLSGVYNKYNVLAATLLLKQIGFDFKQINDAFKKFSPVFGRQEKISYKGKKIQLFLAKNPTSFNQSYTAIKDIRAENLLLVLNDRIPDGRDISWIWDIDLQGMENFKNIIISGTRLYDMALRIKYEGCRNFQTIENLEKAINTGIDLIGKDEILFVLPTYSAMLEVRKILTGRSIL